MSYKSRKRTTRREVRRYERKRFRAAEKAIMRGDHPRRETYGSSWAGVTGMRGRNLPYS